MQRHKHIQINLVCYVFIKKTIKTRDDMQGWKWHAAGGHVGLRGGKKEWMEEEVKNRREKRRENTKSKKTVEDKRRHFKQEVERQIHTGGGA